MSFDHTFFLSHEQHVPRLPVPLALSTVQGILRALEPLLSPEEYAEMQLEALEFLTNPTVQLMQQHLELAAADPNVTCYLNAVNGELYPGVYGDLNGDILPRNPYLVLEEDPYAKTISPPNQAQRAATLINSLLKFMISLRNGTLKTDFTPKLKKPLSMNCYRNLFGTTRVPDALHEYHKVTVKKYRHFDDARHILVICNNQYYALEVLTPFADGLHEIWFNDAELAQALQGIIDEAVQTDTITSVNNGIGAITTQTYSYWRDARRELEATSHAAMAQIDDALLVCVLDPNSPVSDQDKTMVVSHGNLELLAGTNMQVGLCTLRWFDKLQLVVTKNAVAGVVWELLAMDSTAILRFISDIYTDSILKLARKINGAENTLFDERIRFVSGRGDKPQPQRLHFTITPELQHLVHLSETRLADLIGQHEYRTRTLRLDSARLAALALLPDLVLQVAFQIAHFALYGRVANTLEPITTRKFRDARTDLIAVQSPETAELAKLFITSADSRRKMAALAACCALHKKQYLAAMAGHGFERHAAAWLQVLRRPVARANLNRINRGKAPELPELDSQWVPLLLHPLMERLAAPELLISNCGNPALHLFGISPAVDQGFGIGYIVHADKVVVTVSSKHRQTERFLDTFGVVMEQITHLVRALAEPQTPRDAARLRVERLLSDRLCDFAFLGGYDYFDVDEVDLRREELSRHESHLGSLMLAIASGSSSRHHSSANLLALDLSEHRLLELRDRLSPIHMEMGDEPKERIGRPLPV